MRPFHDGEPLIVALPHHGTERFLGDDVGQDDVLVRFGELEPLGVKLGDVGGEYVATAAVIGREDLVQAGELDRRIGHVVGAEIVGHVELAGRSGLQAKGFAVELERRLHVERLADQESLPVVIGDRRKDQPEGSLARHGPGRVARKHVDVAGFQRGEPRGGVERNEPYLAGVVENGRGDRAAQIDVEAAPVTLVVDAGEAEQPMAHAADECAPFPHGAESLRGGG